jgi:hypothetical protein
MEVALDVRDSGWRAGRRLPGTGAEPQVGHVTRDGHAQSAYTRLDEAGRRLAVELRSLKTPGYTRLTGSGLPGGS